MPSYSMVQRSCITASWHCETHKLAYGLNLASQSNCAPTPLPLLPRNAGAQYCAQGLQKTQQKRSQPANHHATTQGRAIPSHLTEQACHTPDGYNVGTTLAYARSHSAQATHRTHAISSFAGLRSSAVNSFAIWIRENSVEALICTHVAHSLSGSPHTTNDDSHNIITKKGSKTGADAKR